MAHLNTVAARLGRDVFPLVEQTLYCSSLDLVCTRTHTSVRARYGFVSVRISELFLELWMILVYWIYCTYEYTIITSTFSLCSVYSDIFWCIILYIQYNVMFVQLQSSLMYQSMFNVHIRIHLMFNVLIRIHLMFGEWFLFFRKARSADKVPPRAESGPSAWRRREGAAHISLEILFNWMN